MEKELHLLKGRLLGVGGSHISALAAQEAQTFKTATKIIEPLLAYIRESIPEHLKTFFESHFSFDPSDAFWEYDRNSDGKYVCAAVFRRSVPCENLEESLMRPVFTYKELHKAGCVDVHELITGLSALNEKCKQFVTFQYESKNATSFCLEIAMVFDENESRKRKILCRAMRLRKNQK